MTQNVGRDLLALQYNNGSHGTGTLLGKHDSKGQDTVYTYDALNRVTEVQRKIGGFEDVCARVTYTYDTNPVKPSFSQYSTGRLTTVQYAVLNAQGQTYGCNGYGVLEEDIYTEMYSYHPAGAVTAKDTQMQRTFYDPSNQPYTATGNVEADYTYDSAGRTLTASNPAGGYYSYDGSNNPVYTPDTFTYTYDTMGRPSGLTGSLQTSAWVSNVHYDYASRMTGMSSMSAGLNVPQTWSYNVNGQLASMGWAAPGPIGGIQYVYSPTNNNGQIAQAVDTLSGETITYTYDALKRLTQASSTPISGGTPAAWIEKFGYDGFSNLTSKTLNGTTTAIPVSAATNQLTNASYDLNGNMVTGLGAATLTYDEANRMVSAVETSGGKAYYGYAADNKRVYVNTSGSLEQWTFYGAKGEKLGVFGLTNPVCAFSVCSSQFAFNAEGMSVSFAGKLIQDSTAGGAQQVVADQLGTNRAGGARFYPYGDEITSTSNNREKFGTYTRDSYTGFDYADQRFYASTYGRFNTPDPFGASAGPEEPGSWNRYSYTRGDPVNRSDPQGLEDDGGSDGCYYNGIWVSGCDVPGGTQRFAPVTAFSRAANRMGAATQAFGDRHNFSQDCQKDIAAIAAAAPPYIDPGSITMGALQNAASQTNFANGPGSPVSQSVLYPNSPQAAGLVANQTIGALFSDPKTLVTAATTLGGNTIYINPLAISSLMGVNEGLLMHELFHELGLADDIIGTGLHSIDPSIQPDAQGNWTNTKQFSTKLSKDCFSGKGNQN